MRFELFVATRYLLARRKQAVISVVTVISIVGVTAGVAALIVALALNNGFQSEFQSRILGATSHINLLRSGNLAILNHQALAERLQQLPEVVSVSPTIYAQAQLVGDLNRQKPAVLRGVDPERGEIARDLFEHIVEGDAGDFRRDPDAIVVGKDLASEMGLLVGDRIRAFGLKGELSPLGVLPRSQTFRVVAVFESGLWEYDANWALVRLRAAQRFVGLLDNEASALEFRVVDPARAAEVASRIKEAAGEGYTARTWIELNRPLFSALKLEKLALFIAISLIVLVASLNIVSTLTMMVMEKNRDIAIIAAMGGGSRTITAVFMLQGLIIGAAGTALGAALGCAAAWYFDAYRVFALEAQVYSIPYVPFRLAWLDVAVVSLTAVVVSFLATVHPARAAARLDPVEVIRYE